LLCHFVRKTPIRHLQNAVTISRNLFLQKGMRTTAITIIPKKAKELLSRLLKRIKARPSPERTDGAKNAVPAKESIRFTDFEIREGRIDFRCIHTVGDRITKENQVFFELNKPIIPSNDAIALACGCMCGNVFERICLDLPCSDNTRESLKKFTGCEVLTRQGDKTCEAKPINSDESLVLLSFSGGTDSLAALSLLPRDKVRLVSTEFGGFFEQEEIGYSLHQPEYLLRTNLRSLDYHRNSWTFMGIGLILFSEYAQAPYFCFGTNLTDSLYHLMENPPLADSPARLPFSALGMTQVCLTNGIGGPAILKIASHYYPEIMREVFESLAKPGSKKRHHKELMLECVEKRFSVNLDINRTEMKDTCNFGDLIETDLQLPYMIKHLGAGPLERFVRNIPQEIYDISRAYDLTFYERVYPAFLRTIPEGLREYYLARLEEAGVKLYTQTDCEEMAVLSDFAWNRYRK